VEETAQAASLAGGGLCTPEKRGVNLALPAVVRVAATYQAQMTYTTVDGTSVGFPQNGGFYQLTVAGTGAFVSGNGDILTAAHLIGPSQADLDALLIQQAAPDIASAIDAANPPQPVTAADIEGQLAGDHSIWQGTYQPGQFSVYFSSQYAGPTDVGSVSDLQGEPVTVTAQSSSDQPNSTDLALLHIDGLHDLPTIALGDGVQVFQGDTLTVLGFPSSADLTDSSGAINPNDYITASVNTVTVSAFKTLDDGSQVIQVSGNVDQGQSGGPALNAAGQVVGVVSFGTTSQTSFLRMASDARALIDRSKMNVGQDTFDKRWAAAYDTCSSTAAGHWHMAFQQYSQLAHLYPNFKGVQLYLDYTKAQAAHEPAPGVVELPAWLVILGSVLVLVLLVLVGMFFIRRRRQMALAGGYAGYGPGLNRGAPDGTAVFRLGGQTRRASPAAPFGPSEQVGGIPLSDNESLPPEPALLPAEQAEADAVWTMAATQPSVFQNASANSGTPSAGIGDEI